MGVGEGGGWVPSHVMHTCPLSLELPWCALFFFFFWLRWVLVAVYGLSPVMATGSYSSLRCTGLSLRWFLLWSTGSRCAGFSSCGTRALGYAGSRAQAQ